MKRIILIALFISGTYLGLQAQVTVGSNDVPTSTLDIKGSVAVPYRVVDNADVTLGDADHTVVITGKGETHINLPDPSTCKGRTYIIVNGSDSFLDYNVNGASYFVLIFSQGGSTNTISKGLTHVLQSTGVSGAYGEGWVVLNNVKSGEPWLLGGNANGEPKTIGTNDAFDLPVTVNGDEAMRVIWDGINNVTRVAVGKTAMSIGASVATVASSTSGSSAAQQLAKFTVNGGDASINGLTIGLGGGQNALNSAIGYQALYSNTTGNVNYASGSWALYSNTTGNNNYGSGYNALYSNRTGSGNHASGYYALYSNTTGYGNYASGFEALRSNTTGNSNYASGSDALYSNTTANGNYASGNLSLYSNTTGSANYASGFQALYSNTTGYGNYASGNFALRSNTTGNSNYGSGYYALYNNQTGSNNVAVGYSALSNQTGNNNVAVGYTALNNVTTGYANVGLGFYAGSNITTGSNNIAIGASVTDMPSNTASSQLNIGNTIFGTGMTGTVASPAGSIGINTTTPNATLEVAGQPTITTVMDGIIPPKITGDQLKAKTYAAAQNGCIVYVTAAASTANQTGQTINVSQSGYYYFDGTNSVWVKLLSNADIKAYKIPTNIFSAEKSADDATAGYSNSQNVMVFDKINLAIPQPAGYGWNGSNTYKVYNPGVYMITAGVGVQPVITTGNYSIQIYAGPSSSQSFTIASGTPITYKGNNCSFGNASYVALLAKDDVINVYYAKAPGNSTAFGEIAHSFIHIVYTPQ